QWNLQFEYPQYFDYDYDYTVPTRRDMRKLTHMSSALTYIFEPLGVDTSDWSMDFGTGGRFAFRERFGSPSSPQEPYRSAWDWVIHDEDLQKLSCEELQTSAVRKVNRAFEGGVP